MNPISNQYAHEYDTEWMPYCVDAWIRYDFIHDRQRGHSCCWQLLSNLASLSIRCEIISDSCVYTYRIHSVSYSCVWWFFIGFIIVILSLYRRKGNPLRRHIGFIWIWYHVNGVLNNILVWYSLPTHFVALWVQVFYFIRKFFLAQCWNFLNFFKIPVSKPFLHFLSKFFEL